MPRHGDRLVPATPPAPDLLDTVRASIVLLQSLEQTIASGRPVHPGTVESVGMVGRALIVATSTAPTA